MKTTDIEKIRQLLWEIRSLADNDEPDPDKGEHEPCFPRIKRLADETLGLLPCKTCEGLGRIVVPRKNIPGVDWEPCLDCTVSGGGI